VYTAKVAGNGEEAKLVQPETHPADHDSLNSGAC
jgi:hypothetical protein